MTVDYVDTDDYGLPGDPLFDQVEAVLRRFVVMSDDAYALVTTWVFHVYAFEAFEFTPYLAVTSATKRSGKSRLLEIVELLLGQDRSISTANISPASLYRWIDANPGIAVLFDEVDRIPKEKADELWGMINSGWRLGGKVHRQSGAKFDTMSAFSVFTPKVFAGIGQPVPDTTADRTLPIRMERRLQDEHVERLRLRQVTAELAPLREALAKWASATTIKRLREAHPALPNSMNDRLMDVSEPLFAIADLAGGSWPARVRAAVVAKDVVDDQVTDEDLGILALRHVYEVFTLRGADRLTTDEILASMVTRDDGPWAEWWGDKVDAGKSVGPARRLRKLLERFEGITPKVLRMDGRTPRGYEVEPVREAISRYLPHLSATSETSATPLARHVADVALVADTPHEVTPEPGCVRCDRYGADHVGDHTTTWTKEER